MLETEEVDVDYFTPAESTSLSSIFGKGCQIDEAKDNTTLKYVPPAPPTAKTEEQEVKPTKWIFTCTVHGFEWSSSGTSGYIDRGKLGLAILKVTKTNSHSIILYDSNKSTLSFAPISSKLKIHKRDALNVSYYDNSQKCWNIQTSNDDMHKMLQLLQELQATIVYKSSKETDREQSDSNKPESKHNVTNTDEAQKEEREVDTDSYMNQKTKDSILRRMAHMGHSVLPSHGISKGQTSDSSDSDEIDGGKKNFRHKPAKNQPRKGKDFSLQDTESNIGTHLKKNIPKSHNDVQPPPSTLSNYSPNSGDINFFISEQRMSNGELRININRMSDKIDLVLERLSDLSNIEKNNTLTSFQNEIVQKLMKEYESKIKSYENIMHLKGIDFYSINGSNDNFSIANSAEENEVLKVRMDELEKECIDQEKTIATLKNEIKQLNDKNTETEENNKKKIEALRQEINLSNDDLKNKNEEILQLRTKLEEVCTIEQENVDTASSIKKIMNDTFQTISSNFNDADSYTGESIKAVIASVIKKTTIAAIKEL